MKIRLIFSELLQQTKEEITLVKLSYKYIFTKNRAEISLPEDIGWSQISALNIDFLEAPFTDEELYKEVGLENQ